MTEAPQPLPEEGPHSERLGGFDVCGQGFDWSLLRNRCGSRHVGGGLSLDVAADFSSL